MSSRPDLSDKAKTKPPKGEKLIYYMRNYNSKRQQKSITPLDKCQRTWIDNQKKKKQKWSIKSQKNFQLHQWFKSQLNNSFFANQIRKDFKKTHFDKQKKINRHLHWGWRYQSNWQYKHIHVLFNPSNSQESILRKFTKCNIT